MPTAPISPDVHLFYEDTGAPNGSATYTTLLLIHGVIFHSVSFKRMLPYATEHNLRIVRVNLREYPGSSAYTPAEVDAFRSEDRTVVQSAIKAYGAEIAAFLAWFAETYDLPLPRRDAVNGTAEGGLAVFVWSSTASVVVSMLAHASELPDKTLKVLEAYLRAAILFDASVVSYGIEPPASLYSPTRDTSLTLAEKNDRSAPWLAAYYSNADPHPSRSTDASPPTPLDDPPSSLAGLVPELDQIADPGVINGVQGLILFLDPAIFYENTLRAFGIVLDHQAAGSRRPLAELAIEVVWCDMSIGDCVYGAWALEQMCKSRKETSVPPVSFHRFQGVNHFAVWDQPERTTAFIASLLR